MRAQRARRGGAHDLLAAITTHHLVADIERLRRHLGVERWLVLGGSWGSTLALAYAERHPDRGETELVLFSVGTTTRREVEWVTLACGRFFPAQWERFATACPPAERDGSLVEAYGPAARGPGSRVRARAARDRVPGRTRTCGRCRARRPIPATTSRRSAPALPAWSRTSGATPPGWGEDELLSGVDRIGHVPAVLVHGRLDVSSPLDVPWALAARCPRASSW
jgi:proline iminopeptidase